MRQKFITYISKANRQMPEERREQIIHFAENQLADFIRKYFDSKYPGLYACTDLNFYRELEAKMQTNAEMRLISDIDDLYSLCIYHYKNFLSSKQFKGTDRPILATNENKSKKKVHSIEEPKKESDPLLPESEEPSVEGKSRQVNITRYERDPKDRKKALDRDNYQCQVCRIKFELVYGETGKDYIEVHHLYPVSNMGEDYKFKALDPERGLVCLCANCHAMIHRGGHYEERDGKRVMIPMSLKELQKKYNDLNHKF
jgi:hypothetical protein